MSTREKLIKARLGMLALAEELQNISLACRRPGISRSHFYEIREAFEKYGAEGLAPRARRRPRMPNETPPELEGKILEMTERYPTYSYLRISQQLRLVGLGVSPSAVRYLWQRHGRPLHHPFELFLAISQIEHRRTGVASPETNGFRERFHRTLKEEFFSVVFRKTFYESLEQLQSDLDQFLNFYNRERAHQGYRTQGRTPYQTFLDRVKETMTKEAA